MVKKSLHVKVELLIKNLQKKMEAGGYNLNLVKF